MVNALFNRVSMLALACMALLYSVPVLSAPGVASPGKADAFYLVENKGQITDQHKHVRKDIDFRLKAGKGVDVFMSAGELHYQWTKSSATGNPEDRNITFEAYRLDVVLEGANKKAMPVAEEKADYFERYYTPGMDGVQALAYRKVTYRNIYNNIDWVFYAQDGRLKYDFIVHEGGRVEDIRIRYEGATGIMLEDGDVRVTTPQGEIVEKAPYTYHAYTKQVLPSSFRIEGNTLTFAVAQSAGPIVIDPTLEWGTYKGYTGEDYGYGLVVDTAQNPYMAGYTANSSNIIISGAHQVNFGGVNDGFIIKYTPAGIPVWCTYYGGAGDDAIYSLRLNSAQELIFSGITASANTGNAIATNGAHQQNFGGGNYDCFLGKLEVTNGARVWGTYYGGAGDEKIGIGYYSYATTDAADNIYLVGSTNSDTGIATSGTAQSSRKSMQDGFIAKFNNNGVRQWGTYFGGTYDERFTSIAVSAKNMLYVLGESNSDSLGTAGTHARYRFAGQGSSDHDIMITKFNSANGALLWATYYGGNIDDISRDIVIKDSTGVYISGSTSSTTGIVGSSPAQPSIGGLNDIALACFDSVGTRVWGTYLGGSGTDHGGRLLVDGLGNLHFCGSTASTDNMATQGAYRQTLGNAGGTFDAVVGAYTPTGSRIWSSYYGGTNNDYGYGLAITKGAHLYICGNTASTSDIAYSGAQNSLGGGNDAYLVKFTPDTSVFIFQPFNQLTHCVEDSFTLKYGVTSPFNNNNVFTVQLSNSSGSFASPTNIGTITSGVDGNIRCGIPSSLTGTGFRIRIVATLPVDTSYDNGLNITIKPRPVKPTASSNTPVCSNDTLKLYATTSTGGVSWGWTGPSYTASTQNPTRTVMTSAHSGAYIVTANLNGCSRSDTTNVTIRQAAPKPDLTANTPLCSGNTLQFNTANYTGTGSNITWSGPAAFSANGQQNPQRANAQTNFSGDYIVFVEQNNCYSKDTVNVLVKQTPAPVTATGNSPVCTAETLFLYANTSTGGVTYSWSGPVSFTANTANTSRTGLTTAMSGDYIVTADLSGCTVKDTVTISVLPSPAKPDATATSPLCSGADLYLVGTNIGSNTASWVGPNFSSTGKDKDTLFNAQVADAGNYILTSTAANGCKMRDTVTVAITQSSTLSVTASIDQGTVVCPTANITFKVLPAQPPGAQYTWTGPGGLTNPNTPTPSKNNVQYSDSGYYVIRVVTAACSAGIDSIKLRVVDTISKPVLTSNSPVCDMVDTLRLMSTHVSNAQRTWKLPDGSTLTGAGIIIFTPTFTDSGMYVVTAEAGGCKASDSIRVVVKPTPAQPTANSNSPICELATLNLNSNSTTPGVSYLWQGPSSFSSTTQNPSIPNVSPAIHPGAYVVKALLNGCYSLPQTTVVVVNPNPKPDILWAQPVCEGSELAMSVTKEPDETYSWASTFGSGFTATGGDAVIPAIKLSDKGKYKVTAKNTVTGCEGTDEADIDVIPLPGITQVTFTAPLCEGKQLELNVKDTSTFVSYLWTGPNNYTATSKYAIKNDIQLTDSGYYKVMVSRDPGCTRVDSVFVEVRPTPPPPVLTATSPLTVGEDLQLNITNAIPGLTFKWTGPNGFGSLVQNPTVYDVTMASAGNYYVVTTLNGCVSTGQVLVTINDKEAKREELILYPNPNNGIFTVRALLSRDQIMPYEVLNSIGMVVYRDIVQSQGLAFEQKISIDGKLASGYYIFRIMMSGQSKEIPFTIVR